MDLRKVLDISKGSWYSINYLYVGFINSIIISNKHLKIGLELQEYCEYVQWILRCQMPIFSNVLICGVFIIIKESKLTC